MADVTNMDDTIAALGVSYQAAQTVDSTSYSDQNRLQYENYRLDMMSSEQRYHYLMYPQGIQVKNPTWDTTIPKEFKQPFKQCNRKLLLLL